MSISCEEVRNRTFSKGYLDIDQRPVGALVQAILFYLELLIIILFVLAFAYFKFGHPNREKFFRIRARSLRYIVVTHLGAIFAFVTGSFGESRALEQDVPCIVNLFISFNIVSFLLLPPILRLYIFYRRDEVTRILADRQAAATTVDHQETGTNADSEEAMVVVKCFGCISQEMSKDERLAKLRYQSSSFTVNVLMVLFLCPYFLSAFVFIGLHPNVTCPGCTLDDAASQVLLVESVAALVVIAVLLYLCRTRNDQFGVLREIKLSTGIGGIPAVVFFVLGNRVTNVGEFRFSTLLELSLVVYCFFQSAYQCWVAAREFKIHSLAKKSYTLSQTEFYSQVLRPEGVYHSAFYAHLEMEHSFESLAFLLAVFDFEDRFYDRPKGMSNKRGRKLIARFVGEEAAMPVNISGKMATELLRLSQENLDLDAHCFEKAKGEIVMMLYLDTFARFVATKAFQQIFDQQQTDNMMRIVVGTPGEDI